MRIIIISSSPNKDGLTAACADAAIDGVVEAGGKVELVSLNELKVGLCQACDNGWGTCLEQHECQVLDDFQGLHQRTCSADGLVLVTPVYWGEMSEISQGVHRQAAALRSQSG